MKTKLVSLLLCLTVLVGMLPYSVTAASDNPFTDVASDAYYYEPVLWAVDRGITTGTTENTFSPDSACTRGQIVTFLYRAAGCPEVSTENMYFTDVKETEYYYTAVAWALEQNITAGISATAFGPDDPCTRGQIVTFLYRFAGSPETPTDGMYFTDVAADAYYYAPVAWALAQNITTGISATAFGSDDACTRGQIVTFLYRYMSTDFEIVTQPADHQMQSSYESASFTVEVAGGCAPYEYQWVVCYGSELSRQEPVSSVETSNTLTRNFTDYDFDDCDRITVYCSVTDANGNSVKSRSAEVLQYTPLHIVSQPADYQMPDSDDDATFTVEVAGGCEPYKYQWYICYDSGYIAADPVTTDKPSNTLIWNVTADEVSYYDTISVYCVITDASGVSVQSDRADVLHYEPLCITEHPTAYQMQSSEEYATFTVEVSGGSAPYEYQWYVYYDNGYVTEEPVSTNETSNTLTVYVTEEELDYYDSIWVYCVITDASGEIAESYNAYVLPGASEALRIVTQPADFQMHGTSGNATFTVEVAGGTAPYKYQWTAYYDDYYDYGWIDQPEITSSSASNTLTLAVTEYELNFFSSISVYCIITDASGNSVETESAFVLEYTPMQIATQPASYLLQSAAEDAAFSVQITGGAAPYRYQWYVYYDSGFILASNVQSNSKSNTFIWEVTQEELEHYDQIYVYCVVIDAAGNRLQSNRAFVTSA